MHTKKSYYELLKDPRWQKKRLEILSRDQYTCQFCKDKESTLHVHHLCYFKGDPWDIPDSHLLTLCENCHDHETQALKSATYDFIQISKSCGFTSDVFIAFTTGIMQSKINWKHEPNLSVIKHFLTDKEVFNTVYEAYFESLFKKDNK